MTEYRGAREIAAANRATELLFETLFSDCADMRPSLVVAVNTEKRRAGSPEQTYRMGLLYIIALVEASFDESDVISSLQLEIATRTKDGERLATFDCLKEDARSSLRDAIEMGFASRGLLSTFNSNALQLQFRPASQSWGIAVADFLANTVYNRHHPTQSSLLAAWTTKGVYAEFQSCGGYEERRARVAERDRDYVSALSRWALMGEIKSAARLKSLERVWSKVLRNTGTTGPLTSMQAVVERIARYDLPYHNKIDALLALQSGLESALHPNGPEPDQLLFRLRNLLLLLGNHTGSHDLATKNIVKQQSALQHLLTDAEALPLAMQFGALIVDASINDLNFDAALTCADAHYKFVEDFLSAWQLFTDDAPQTLPRWQLRAAGTLARTLAVRMQPSD